MACFISTVENLAYSTRQTLFADAKRRIARLAAQQIPDGASLFINIGTTTEEVAKALIHHKDLKVITNNLNVASVFSDVESGDVTIAGGLVRKRDRGIMGEATLDFIRQFKVDFGVIGISGIELDGTLLDFDFREVQVAKAIIANARQILLVADHTKFGRSAMVRLGSINQVDALITDRPPPEAMAEILAEADTRLYIAEPN
jgi:DeoR family glycerol-3-phosphate regulon repressor